MLDISIQIKGRQLTGASTDSSTSSLVGDITDVYDRARITEAPSPDSSLVFVHVTGVPVLNVEAVWFLANPTLGPENQDGEKTVLHKHEFYFDINLATPDELSSLTNDRQVTTTWERIKLIVKRRSNGQLLTDADLNG